MGAGKTTIGKLLAKHHCLTILEDGQTVVLGGVFRNTIANNQSKVPFLGDLPGVGKLFRNDTKSNTKEELLIFVTPKIVYDNVGRY